MSTRQFTRRGWRSAALAALAASTALLTGAAAAPAHADTNDIEKDISFLTALTNMGVPEPAGDAAAIHDAHLACTLMRSGQTPVAVADELYRVVGPYSSDDAYHFVGAAIGVYCLDQASRIGSPDDATGGQQV